MVDEVRAHGDVAALVVTYEPGDIRPLLQALRSQCSRIVVVDNGSSSASALGDVCAAHGAELLALPTNIGIAAAQNAGMDALLGAGWRVRETAGPRAILLFDQDSVPSHTMVDELLPYLRGDVAAVGPLPREVREADGTTDELAYVSRTWGPRRATPGELSAPALDAAFLIASGCLISTAALRDVGPMNAAWFIDHVDLEWGLRARRRGWRLLVIPAAALHHSLGDNIVKLPRRAQPVHVHSPARTYYLARNTIALIRSGLLPARWAIGYLVWLTKYAAFNGLAVPPRRERIRRMGAGIRDGLLTRAGRAPATGSGDA